MSRVVLAFFLAFVFAKKSLAEPVVTDHVQIILDTKASKKKPMSKKERSAYHEVFRLACDKIGRSLLAGAGPWGFGIFNSFGCYRGNKFLGGVNQKSKWQVLVTDSAQSIAFEALYFSSAGTKVELARVSYPPSKSFFKFFADDEFTDLVAFSLLERMPMGALVFKARVGGTPPQFNGRYIRAGRGSSFKYDTPDPPGELTLFSLEWDEPSKTWRSAVQGTAKKMKIVKPNKKTRKSRLRGGSVVYEVTEALALTLAKGPLYAQSSAGPGYQSEDLDEIGEDALEKLQAADNQGRLLDFINGRITGVLDKILDTAASGYVAVRYGKQVLTGDEMLNKTSIFGLLVEVRGGPLQGLRYYYDKMPKVELARKLADGGGEVQTSIESARHVLGFAFDFRPGFLVDKLTVDPKLGRWNFKAVLPTEKNLNGDIVSIRTFDLGNTFSTALEVGAEMLANWYTIRGWYSIDSGFSLLKSGGQVTSNRFGIDAYFTAGPSFPIFGIPFKTALLAFFFYEDVALKLGRLETPQPGETAIEEVGYEGGFAGLGLGVTW